MLFTIDDLDLAWSLKRCLGTTNIIDSLHSAVHQKAGRVKRWQSGQMALRWMAVAYEVSSRNFKREMGYKDFWILKANLEAMEEEKSSVAESIIASYTSLVRHRLSAKCRAISDLSPTV